MHWFPFNTADFIGATLELSFDERATYCWMLVIYYETERPLPSNKNRLNRLLGAESIEQKERIQRLSKEFFVEMDGRLYNEQCEKILVLQKTKSDKARDRVEKRWKKTKSNENNEHSDTVVLPQQYDTRSKARARVKDLKSTPLSGKPPDVRKIGYWNFTKPPDIGHEAHYILAFLNKVTNHQYQAVDAILKKIRQRLTEFTIDQMKAAIVNKDAEWADNERMRKYLRPKTLFAAENMANYVGEATENEV